MLKKLSKQDKIITGVAILSVLVAGTIFIVKKIKAKKEQEAQAQLIADANNDDDVQPKNTTTTPKKPSTPSINKNKVLQRGAKGLEVKELQKLLGVTADGDFGSKTETALINKKGVKSISLNAFPRTTKPITIGTKIMSVAKPTKLWSAGKQANGGYFNGGTKLDEINYGVHIGTYAGKTGAGDILVLRDKIKYVVKEKDIKFY